MSNELLERAAFEIGVLVQAADDHKVSLPITKARALEVRADIYKALGRPAPVGLYPRPEELRSEPTAWAIFAADTHEMIDVVLIEPEEPIAMYAEPLYMRSPLARSQHVCEEAWFDSMADRCPACREEKK